MCQTFKAVEIVRAYENGSKEIIAEVTCKRCSGNGVFQQYAHIDKGLCYECNGTGVTEKSIKVSKSDKVEMVNRTTQIKKVKKVNDDEAMRNAMLRINAERKQDRKEIQDLLKKVAEENRQHEEDMKNNPEEYSFKWDF